MADPSSLPPRERFPRVPAYAWVWLQRSRPVLDEAARQLTGRPATPAFLDHLRDQFPTDPFVRDILVGVVADVAFNGRMPDRRPPGTAWDRGLTWWAAAIAGMTPQEFEARSGPPRAAQRPLFDARPDDGQAPVADRPRGSEVTPRRPATPGRAALAAALRELLATAEGDQVPASAVRQLLAELEDR